MYSILLKIYQIVFGYQKTLQRIEQKLDAEAVVLQQIIGLLTFEQAATVELTVTREDGTTNTGAHILETLRDDQKIPVTVSIKDKKGADAQVDGVPVWASSDETIVTATDVAADGMSGFASGVTPGVARITVTADADLGSGVVPIVGILDVTVTGGGASVIALTAGAPVDQ